MASYILTENGNVVVRKSIWALSAGEVQTNKIKQAMTELNEKITLKIDDSLPLERDCKGEEAGPFTPPPPDDMWCLSRL